MQLNNRQKTPIAAVLFDLDGTLLDTAHDMAYALNQQRLSHQLPPLALEQIRPCIGEGARGLLALSFNLNGQEVDYQQFVDEFLTIYHQHLCIKTQLFSGMEKVLTYLEQASLPWGIVTNKPSRFTLDLLQHLALTDRAACIVSGDTLSRRKPHPDTILHACQLLQLAPEQCLYVGDASTDIIASKAAGTQSLVALYGYIHEREDPYSWLADGYLTEPLDLLNWLQENRKLTIVG